MSRQSSWYGRGRLLKPYTHSNIARLVSARESAILIWMTLRLRWIFGLLVLVSLSVALRLTSLRSTPAMFSHDELHYISEAQSIAISGSDLTGKWHPWELRPTSPLYAELPSTVMALGSVFFSDPFLKARITHILIGVLLAVVLGGIGWNLTGKKGVFWTTLVIGLLNPWLFQFSRMSFDSLFSLFFYSLGVLGLLALPSKWRLISFLALGLGFFQYQGLKIIFLPIVFLTVGYILWRDWPAKAKLTLGSAVTTFRKQSWDLLIIALLSFVLFGWFLKQLPTQSAAGRVNDIIFFNDTFLSRKVNEQRLLSLEDPAGKLSVNKVTVIIQEFLTKYAQTFDPSQLFIRGESVRNPFSVWARGMFYPIDALLIAAGAVAVLKEKKWMKQSFLLLGFVLISPLPVAVNSVDTWVMFRGSWMIVTFVLVMGIGAYYLFESSQRWQRLLFLLLLGMYAICVLSFANEYFYRYPVYSTKGTSFAERVLASYIHRLPAEKKVIVLVDEARFVFESYLVYNGLITKENLPAIHQAMQDSVYTLGNVTFATDCLDTSKFGGDTILINNSVNVTCDQKPVGQVSVPYAKIPSLLDNGVQFVVYNDQICDKYALRPFVHVTDSKYLDVEPLSNMDFCDQLFSKPIE